ncbi:uncharacterized protein LOC144116893 [Amblyomma americanum]
MAAGRSHSRRAAPDSNDTAKQPQWQDGDPGGPREEQASGLPSAWVAAIAVNVVLVALFLVFVLYCYIRSRKRAKGAPFPEERGFETQMDKATTQPLALEAPRPLAWPPSAAVEHRQLDLPVISTHSASVHRTKSVPQLIAEMSARMFMHEEPFDLSGSTETPIIEGVDDDEEPELKDLSPDESEEELPSEPLPAFGDALGSEPLVTLPASRVHQAANNGAFLPGAPTSPKGILYQVCLLAGGGRDCVGSLELPLEQPVTLAELRAAFSHAPDPVLRELATLSRFVTEAHRPLSPAEEATYVVHQVYPSRAVMLRDTTEVPEASPPFWEGPPPSSATPPVISHDPEVNPSLTTKVMPTRPWRKMNNSVHSYVGPLGVCQRPDCNQAGRVKCIDCGLASYCTSRCLKADAARHSLSCYRPPWRT